MNRAIVQGTMENAEPVNVSTMQYLRGIQKQRADFYMTRLQDYLLIGRGQNKFPQYNTQSTIDGMIPDRTQKYQMGISLTRTTRKGYGRGNAIDNGLNPGYSELAHSNPPCMDCY
jgi:hypothetical protein